MTREEYKATQEFIMNLARQVQLIDLTEFLNSISLSHAMGPIVDPTLYRDAHDNLSKIEKIARAAAEFRRIVMEVRDE